MWETVTFGKRNQPIAMCTWKIQKCSCSRGEGKIHGSGDDSEPVGRAQAGTDNVGNFQAQGMDLYRWIEKRQLCGEFCFSYRLPPGGRSRCERGWVGGCSGSENLPTRPGVVVREFMSPLARATFGSLNVFARLDRNALSSPVFSAGNRLT